MANSVNSANSKNNPFPQKLAQSKDSRNGQKNNPQNDFCCNKTEDVVADL